MKHCDIRTGRIYGCKKGSLAYYHEEGHIEYNKSEIGSNNQMVQSNIFLMWMTFITLSIYKPHILLISLTIIMLLLYSWLDFYEEIWCWGYAKKKLNKRRKNK